MVRPLLILLLLIGCAIGSQGTLARESGRQDQGILGTDEAMRNCRNVHKRHGVLVAECRQSDGSWRRMRLEGAKDCQGKNRKDSLACAGGS